MKRGLIRAAISIAVVVILLRIIPLRAVLDALGRVSAWTWTCSLLIFFAGHCLNAFKLRVLIGQPLAPFTLCVRAQFAGLVANLGLPGLSGGDFVRAAYLAPSLGTKRVALASVADRMVDGLIVAALVAVALPFAGVPPVLEMIVGGAGGWMLVAGMIVVVLVICAVALRRYLASANRLNQTWEILRARRSAFVAATAISLAVQSAFVMVNVWLARQIGVTTGLAPWFMAWPLSKLVSVLPISLGGLGVREAALVSLLAPYGAPREAVLASGIVWRAVLTVSGLAGLLITQLLPRTVPTVIGSKVESA